MVIMPSEIHMKFVVFNFGFDRLMKRPDSWISFSKSRSRGV